MFIEYNFFDTKYKVQKYKKRRNKRILFQRFINGVNSVLSVFGYFSSISFSVSFLPNPLR